MSKNYRSYFQINESYFPAVNEDVIKNQPNHWKTYYPHDSFIRLLNQTKNVLTNNQHMSIWVEGAYGTGKSHAVLTLKKILECSNAELKEYFDNYSNVLSKDLYNEFYNIKNQTKKVLTVHRYGSSNVRNDNALMNCIQSSIINALKENGYSYLGSVGIKDAIINWLLRDNNRNYFDSLISEKYKVKFGGDNAEMILNKLKNFKDDNAIQDLTDKISFVGEEEGIKVFVLDKENLKTWILDVIQKNNLKAIFFIWDEFSDYFNINKKDLSGFQFMAEMSEIYPFYFVIVTHKSDVFFEDNRDDVKTKINGRFISPHCLIELPDNMAFILTAHAMQKNNDKELMKEWEEIIESLYDETHNSRNSVMTTARIGEQELKGVLPIHPYAALVLKHIASAFDSNQRSMFDFIKNDRGDEIKGFQWFIDNYGPFSDENLLTVDMLWDFFYEKGKDQLAPRFRVILDVYNRINSHTLFEKDKRVLRTILLLQAINEKVGDSVLLFIPNEKNLGLAFEGTNISASNAISIANNLIREQIIFERQMGGGLKKYSALIANGNQEEINKEKERLEKETRTDKLIEEAEFLNDFKLPKNLDIRFVVKLLTKENIKMEVTKIKADSTTHPSRLYCVFTFARSESESEYIRNEIKKTFLDGFDRIIFADYSSSLLSSDLYMQYIEAMANCNYYINKDKNQARTFDKNAKDVLKKWKSSIKLAQCRVYSSSDLQGTVYNDECELEMAIMEFDKKHFELSLETHINVIDTMYASNALKQGAECGITGEIKGTYKSANENTKLEKQFSGVWNIDKYWEVRPNELLSKFKNRVMYIINKNFEIGTRVAITDIYDSLIEAPYGILPCNITAFVLGYILKEFANEEYNWTDDLTTVPMSVEKMKEMIEEIIKHNQNPNPKYKTKYIVAMTKEQREFNKSTSYCFNINESLCSSIEATRNRVRETMKSFIFPIWTLNYALDDFSLSSSKKVVEETINLYCKLANNNGLKETETEIALSIGEIFLANPLLKNDLRSILSKEKCIFGMNKYLNVFEGGSLINLAKSIGNTGSYINEISKKISESGNWVWNKNTVDEKILELILEYSIVSESNRFITNTKTYSDCINEWAKKCSNFKMAYRSIRNEVPEITEFLGILYQIKKNSSIYDMDKQIFLNCLKTQISEFKNFCDNQNILLKKVGSFYFSGLTDEDIYEISKSIYDVYELENSEFLNKLDFLINTYKSNMARYKLKDLWKKKTSTDSPLEWSEKYMIPILCMIKSTEQDDARNVFDSINNQTNNSLKINEAIEFIEKYDYWDELYDESVRNRVFRKAILSNYSSLFDDLDEVKKTMKEMLPNISVYNWYGSTAINELIKQMAYQKYNCGGSTKVNNVIDSMSPDQLKTYLKNLVKENMLVGIEIINNIK